jgi:predicted transcriptional regulator
MAEETPVPAVEAEKIDPVAKILATLDKAIADKKAELETLNKAKSEANSVVSIGKQKGISEEPIAGVIEALVAKALPKVKTVRAKVSTGAAGHVGGRGRRIPAAKIARIKALRKDGLSNYAIAKKLGITPKTAGKY